MDEDYSFITDEEQGGDGLGPVYYRRPDEATMIHVRDFTDDNAIPDEDIANNEELKQMWREIDLTYLPPKFRSIFSKVKKIFSQGVIHAQSDIWLMVEFPGSTATMYVDFTMMDTPRKFSMEIEGGHHQRYEVKDIPFSQMTRDEWRLICGALKMLENK